MSLLLLFDVPERGPDRIIVAGTCPAVTATGQQIILRSTLADPAVARQSLFTTQTPASTDVSEAQPLTLATTVTFSAPGTVPGGRFYAPATVGAGTFELVLYRVDTDDNPAATGTGTQLAAATFGALTPGAWNTALFSAPVTVTPGTAYRIGVRTSEGRYTATGGFFASAPLVNGYITGIQTGTDPVGIGALDDGSYIESTSTYPNKTFNGACYFVDPLFDLGAIALPTAGPIVVTAGTAVPASAAILLRPKSVDDPAPTTASPLVVSRPGPAATAAAMLLRSSLADVAVASAGTTSPTVVTRPAAAPSAAAILVRPSPADQPTSSPYVPASAAVRPAQAAATLLRGALADDPVLTTASPTVITARPAIAATPPIVMQAPAAQAAVAATASPQPLVVTYSAVVLPVPPVLLRSTLADPPVLTTASPLVVTAPAPASPAAAILIRAAQPAAAVVSGPTTAPLVVTAPAAAPGQTVRVLRAHLQDTVAATGSPLVVTAATPVRVAPPILARGSLADLLAATQPLVVAAAPPAQRGTVFLGRSPQPAVTATLTTASPTVITARQPTGASTALLVRPSLTGVFTATSPSRDLTTWTSSLDATTTTRTGGHGDAAGNADQTTVARDRDLTTRTSNRDRG